MVNNNVSVNILYLKDIIKNIANGNDNWLETSIDVEARGKITRILSKFIVTPTIVVSKDLQYIDQGNLANIIKTETKIFLSVFVSTVKVMIQSLGADVQRVINTVGGTTNRITLGDVRQTVENVRELAFEAFEMPTKDINEDLMPAFESEKKIKLDLAKLKATHEYDLIKDANAFINSYDITLTVIDKNGNERQVTLPFIIKPNIVFTNMKTLLENLIGSNEGASFFERLEEVLSGGISWSEFFTASDLIKKYKQKKISNENDIAKLIKSYNDAAAMKDLIHGRVHFSKNYFIYIMTMEEKALLDKLVKGNTLKDRYKDRACDELNAFSIAYVDDPNERVIILLSDIPGYSVLNYRMIKKESKNDIDEIVKALLVNKPPF